MQTIYTVSFWYATTEDNDIDTYVFKTEEQAKCKFKELLYSEMEYYSLWEDSFREWEWFWPDEIIYEESNCTIRVNKELTIFSVFWYWWDHVANCKLEKHDL